MTDDRKCDSCQSESCPAQQRLEGEDEQAFRDRQRLILQMRQIKNKIVVLSGKGGVGKSTVAVNLALSLSLAGKKVGLLDVDIHGPSVPEMLKFHDQSVQVAGERLVPVQYENLKVMSLGFMLRKREDAVIWRGPMKMNVIRQFLKDVAWGELDYLVIDCPPGTGDEPLSIVQLIDDPTGAIVVTTPQSVALADVRRSVTFCQHVKLPVLGVVENMSGFVCPKCGEVTDIFKSGGGEALAKEMNVPFLGRVPLDPMMVQAGDDSKPFIAYYGETETGKAFSRIVRPFLEESYLNKAPSSEPAQVAARVEGNGHVRVAVPVANGQLAMHFGHCERFAIFEVNPETKEIVELETPPPPGHEPGVLPKWLAEQGASVIIAGGMGSRAQTLFADNGIAVVTGAPSEPPEVLLEQYLAGTLETGDNVCDH